MQVPRRGRDSLSSSKDLAPIDQRDYRRLCHSDTTRQRDAQNDGC